MRSDTRQFTRRSRSPEWKGRMPANSAPSPLPARAVGADQAVRLRRLRGAVERRRRRQHAHLRAVLEDRPPPIARPGTRQRDPLLAQGPPAPAPGAHLEHRHAVTDQAADAARGRVQGDVRRLRAEPGDVLDRRRPTRSRAVTWCPVPRRGRRGRGLRAGPACWSAGAPGPTPPARPAERPARPGPGRRTAPHRRSATRRPGARDSVRASPCHRCHQSSPYRPALRLGRTPSSVEGVGTDCSTASTTRRPLAWVIQSSGLTVIRCESTDRATTLTSSGIT